MGDRQKQKRQREISRYTESNIERAADQKRDPDRALHLLACFPSPAPCHDWPHGRADASRSKQHADAGGGFAGNGKNSFTKYSQKGQDATAHAPGRLHHQISKDTRTVLDVTRAFYRVGHTQSLADTSLLLWTRAGRLGKRRWRSIGLRQ